MSLSFTQWVVQMVVLFQRLCWEMKIREPVKGTKQKALNKDLTLDFIKNHSDMNKELFPYQKNNHLL